ncbi:MAG: hypothetical protein PF489_00310 [Salinivirgaceae bacterium]|jgi:tetratricopeptide (TPR) repeat protein|nr:hypothetical protein [Salinivirgaceae bacterium]
MKLQIITALMLASVFALFSCGNPEYDKAIEEADALYTESDYQGAKTLYEKALKISPDEEYPKTQLDKVNGFLQEIAKQKAIEDAKIYKALIEKADKFYNEKDYQVAKDVYMNASEVKPNEAYPKTQIAKINKIIAEQEAMNNYPYHIVVGCFEVDKNAERYLEKIRSHSSDARSIPILGGRMDAVTYKSYKTLSDAYRDLSKGKEIAGEAWVMRK